MGWFAKTRRKDWGNPKMRGSGRDSATTKYLNEIGILLNTPDKYTNPKRIKDRGKLVELINTNIDYKEEAKGLLERLDALEKSERNHTKNIVHSLESVLSVAPSDLAERAGCAAGKAVVSVVESQPNAHLSNSTGKPTDDEDEEDEDEDEDEEDEEALAGLLSEAEVAENIADAASVRAIQSSKHPKKYHDCTENKDFLFDPCTGEGLTKTRSSLRKIRSRIFEIQESMKKSIPGSEYRYTISGKVECLNNLTTNDVFLEHVFLNKDNLLDRMLYIRLGKGNYVGADIYEVLCRLFVFFGGIEYTDDDKPYRVNPRTGGEYKFMNKFEDTLRNPSRVYSSSIDALKGETCKATNDSGASDVTLSYQSTEAPNGKKQMYIGSVKWLEPEGAPDKNYDIIKLNNQAVKPDLGGKEDLTRNDVGLLLFVKDKHAFYKKCNENQKQYCDMCRYPMGHTFGSNDVKQYLNQIRNRIFEKAECEGITPYQAFIKEYDI